MVVTNFSHASSLLFAQYSFVTKAIQCKFGSVKLWQIAPDLPNLPNLPKFFPATVLRYMVINCSL